MYANLRAGPAMRLLLLLEAAALSSISDISLSAGCTAEKTHTTQRVCQSSYINTRVRAHHRYSCRAFIVVQRKQKALVLYLCAGGSEKSIIFCSPLE
jgi:hypothetical protein